MTFFVNSLKLIIESVCEVRRASCRCAVRAQTELKSHWPRSRLLRRIFATQSES